jgi:Domain of unknown function (DUF362)
MVYLPKLKCHCVSTMTGAVKLNIGICSDDERAIRYDFRNGLRDGGRYLQDIGSFLKRGLQKRIWQLLRWDLSWKAILDLTLLCIYLSHPIHHQLKDIAPDFLSLQIGINGPCVVKVLYQPNHQSGGDFGVHRLE